MAKFEVLNCKTHVEYMQRKRVVDKEGNLHIREVQMEKPISPGFYGVENVKVGDVIEIADERLADKARNNPDLKEVKAGAEAAPKKKASKKK